MGKPFRIANEVARGADGRFAQRYQQPAPPQILRKSTEGTDVLTLLTKPENQAPDHNNAGGRAGAPENPWPAPSTPRPPMRLNK
jgi:hypothetical protein